MGNDSLFTRGKVDRIRNREDFKIQRPSKWLVVCEGTKTEPNYFVGALNFINQLLPETKKLKIEIHGLGKNTTSLVKTALELQTIVDKYNKSIIPYGKVFVVFDKDSFKNSEFQKAIDMCVKNEFIPLWSNQAIEYWFLSHFDYIDCKMERNEYKNKLNIAFKKAGLNYNYQKNDKTIFLKLLKYGKLNAAIRNVKKIHTQFLNSNITPCKCESCSLIYRFFEEIDLRNEELGIENLETLMNKKK